MGRSFPARNLQRRGDSSTPSGLAEKAVHTANIIIMKATASGWDPYIALVEYRTTPILDCGKSPAQLLMSRRLSSTLSATPASLQLAQHRPRYNRPSWTHRLLNSASKINRRHRSCSTTETPKLGYLSRRPDTAEKEDGMLPECGRHCERRHSTVIQCSYEGWCSLQMHQSTSQGTETVRWWCASHGCAWSPAVWDTTLVMCLAWLRLKPCRMRQYAGDVPRMAAPEALPYETLRWWCASHGCAWSPAVRDPECNFK